MRLDYRNARLRKNFVRLAVLVTAVAGGCSTFVPAPIELTAQAQDTAAVETEISSRISQTLTRGAFETLTVKLSETPVQLVAITTESTEADATFLPTSTIRSEAVTPEPTAPFEPTHTATTTVTPTDVPTETATDVPTVTPTLDPTATFEPTDTATVIPTNTPTDTPTETPTLEPTVTMTLEPTATSEPTYTVITTPADIPTETPTEKPTVTPTFEPTSTETAIPTVMPLLEPTPTRRTPPFRRRPFRSLVEVRSFPTPELMVTASVDSALMPDVAGLMTIPIEPVGDNQVIYHPEPMDSDAEAQVLDFGVAGDTLTIHPPFNPGGIQVKTSVDEAFALATIDGSPLTYRVRDLAGGTVFSRNVGNGGAFVRSTDGTALVELTGEKPVTITRLSMMHLSGAEPILRIDESVSVSRAQVDWIWLAIPAGDGLTVTVSFDEIQPGSVRFVNLSDETGDSYQGLSRVEWRSCCGLSQEYLIEICLPEENVGNFSLEAQLIPVMTGTE